MQFLCYENVYKLTVVVQRAHSKKESESNDVMMHFEEFSNVHNSGRSFNATRSSLAYKIV